MYISIKKNTRDKEKRIGGSRRNCRNNLLQVLIKMYDII